MTLKSVLDGRMRLAVAFAVCAMTLLACLAMAPQGASASAAIVGAIPMRYTVASRWTPSTRVFSGSSEITVRNTGRTALTRVWVRMWPNSKAPLRGTRADCSNARETVTRVTGGRVGEYRTSCSAVGIDLTSSIPAGSEGTFTIAFTLTVPGVREEENDESFGHLDQYYALGNVLPTVALEDERGLHVEATPSIGGEAEYNIVADWRVEVEVPTGTDLAMTGNPTTTTIGSVVKYTASARARDVALASGSFQTRTATVGGVTLRVIADRGVARRDVETALTNAREALASYQEWYGVYPTEDFDDLDVLIGNYDEEFGGQEFPGLVFSEKRRGTIAHEIAHQYFYSLVGADSYDDSWLDESFATWNELQFEANTDYRCRTENPLGGSRKGLGLNMSSWASFEEYDRVIYGGGSCALTLLSQEIGRTTFLRLLRDEVSEFRDGIIRTSDFLALISRDAPRFNVEAWARLVGLP